MAVVRVFSFVDRDSEHSARVNEPELDMNRTRPRASGFSRLIELLRWLTPISREVVGPPRRSVGRELEEDWPSRDK